MYVRRTIGQLATSSGAELQALEGRLGVSVKGFRGKLKEMEARSKDTALDTSSEAVQGGDRLLNEVKSMYAELDKAQRKGTQSLQDNLRDIGELQKSVNVVKGLTANQLKAILTSLHASDGKLVDVAFQNANTNSNRTASFKDVINVFAAYVQSYMQESTQAMKVIKTQLGALADKSHAAVRDLNLEAEKYTQSVDQVATAVDAARQTAVQDSLVVRSALRREAMDLTVEAQKVNSANEVDSFSNILEDADDQAARKRTAIVRAVQKWINRHMIAYNKGLTAIQKRYAELQGRG
jgi:hypothetical protein